MRSTSFFKVHSMVHINSQSIEFYPKEITNNAEQAVDDEPSPVLKHTTYIASKSN